MRKTRRQRQARGWVGCIIIVAIALAYGYWTLSQPVPSLKPNRGVVSLQTKTATPNLTWPSSQAAVGIVGERTLETYGEQKPIPIASTAKMITALVVLEKKPLSLNQPGPTYLITDADVQRYAMYVAQGGSVAAVRAGETLTQYQMLQAMLLPSANNMADSLAIWAYGSLSAYQVAATNYLKQHGLTDTTIGSDASGLAPDTTSTASDLVQIGKLVMEQPVLAQIVGQSQVANFPVVGILKNTNYLLGSDGIIGLKTGSSDQAGGAFIGAAHVVVNNQTQTLVTAVIGSPNRQVAMQDSAQLIKTARANFKPVKVVQAGDMVGSYQVPWAKPIAALAAHKVTTTAWQGSTVTATATLHSTQQNPQRGTIVGTVSTQNGTQLSDVILAQTPPQPSIWWRLAHPLAK